MVKDAEVFSRQPTQNLNGQVFRSNHWTFSGNAGIIRGLLDFDLSSIPQNASIITAYLSLYSPDLSSAEFHSGENNASYLSRIIEPWSETLVNWNNQPKTTEVWARQARANVAYWSSMRLKIWRRGPSKNCECCRTSSLVSRRSCRLLVGQPEFRAILQSPNMQQLRQRVTATCHIGPLDQDETRGYIEHRLKCAGSTGRPSTNSPALEEIFEGLSGGIPRRVNLICDRLLLLGYLGNKDAFGTEEVDEVVKGNSRRICCSFQ